ncbi:Uncharacterized protein YR821_1205 [Yersinia ruckeri]|uniref:Uncharacterized protein n=1 Tax=Yersinia ruckeri TaxID=29486 RepID=A0A0A8VBT7_YERRU|nr:Uncharacterized protein YR821_1205 [Yersinia ruckeri]CEK27035.1 hypothetical protein CSF007_6390 [Yersinia ruckeri]
MTRQGINIAGNGQQIVPSVFTVTNDSPFFSRKRHFSDRLFVGQKKLFSGTRNFR